MLKHSKLSIYTSTIGMLVGALPGAGGPVASFIAYNEAKRIVKEPEVPFGEGAVEGIMARESSNNACIGGALIPMLTLAVPGCGYCDHFVCILCSWTAAGTYVYQEKSGGVSGYFDRGDYCLLRAVGTWIVGSAEDQ